MTDILHATRHLELVQDGRWVYVRRPNASAVVVIVAVTPAGELLLITQRRIPVQAVVVELPAGLVGDEDAGEELATAAGRELEEETGWKPTTCRVLASGPSSAGLTSEVVTLIRAEGLTQVGPGGGVAGENITVHRVPLAEVPAWLAARGAEGLLIDHKIHAGLWWLAQPA